MTTEISKVDAYKAIAQAKWERTDLGFPHVFTSDPTITCDVLSAVGFGPQEGTSTAVFYTIKTDGGFTSNCRYFEAPENRFPQGFKPGAIVWNLLGSAFLKTLTTLGVSFADSNKFETYEKPQTARRRIGLDI